MITYILDSCITWVLRVAFFTPPGINGAAVPDMLHQYLLGMVRTAVTLLKTCIAEHGAQGRPSRHRSTAERNALLDSRLQLFSSRHQGEEVHLNTTY